MRKKNMELTTSSKVCSMLTNNSQTRGVIFKKVKSTQRLQTSAKADHTMYLLVVILLV